MCPYSPTCYVYIMIKGYESGQEHGSTLPCAGSSQLFCIIQLALLPSEAQSNISEKYQVQKVFYRNTCTLIKFQCNLKHPHPIS